MSCCSRKKVSRPKTILSKSLEVQEVREMGLYEEGELEGFPGLGMGMIVDCFQVDGKVCVVQERLKICKRKCNADCGRWVRRG